MCTVTWRYPEPENPSVVEVCFNRDERKSRAQAEPPQRFEAEGVSYLCPIDPAREGTWIAGNACGLLVALLNDYHAPCPAGKPEAPSRGYLVRRLAPSLSMDDAIERLQVEMAERAYPPFTLLMWEGARVCQWRGGGGNVEAQTSTTPFVTSSSWETTRVEAWRLAQYEDLVERGGWDLERFHQHAVSGEEASSVLVTRDRTQTVSLTSCRIDAEALTMRYRPRETSGDLASGSTHVLSLRRS